MPRLQILRHKSYHPYNEVNKQRVREDEAKAAAAAEAEEARALAADSEARLDILRRRADHADGGSTITGGTSLIESHRKAVAKEKKRAEKEKLELDWPIKGSGSADVKGKGREEEAVAALEGGKHINFWAGIEGESRPAVEAASKKDKREKEDDSHALYRAIPKPWYADAQLRRAEERLEGDEAEAKRERRRRKEERNKTSQDPMTAVRTALASNPAVTPNSAYPPLRRGIPAATHADPLIAARLQREAAERARALKLVQDAKRAQGLETPRSTVDGDEYGDMWNEDDVRAAKRRREEARHGSRRATWDPRRNRTSGSWEV